ncbi:dTDP-4-amino-4,6-dideoxy-D-galactose acyltransferase [Serratia rhizosphaerae]|uniref:dTDP-4-amino-4,6-dideoxy-D-galactose acyltransferase n=1 Tax=Serratia sp. JUb9 TaxID=2724469 RepID=UPI00164DFEB4|nr:dTDP-4-amino-4,6-dideoxy-D-galactose acyltransferase [Serratia sp. JUb9]MBU3892753.1 dTDP-4-amino-4,6-dideoxy-D-galactose acyltransferase [Serratia rubidaea]QNK32328.1 dTDP-4-amino-4,6-dideoxy-D-galactose acyltransferase [Serratia sp. JUb9]QPT12603.1 dTDP-4-amino-4,6-dideoxy-D-galactose acyltransferase [Serratia rubidaea]
MILRATVDPLTWESDYFRINSARLNIAASAPPLTAAALDRFTLVQAKIPSHRLDLADALTTFGFQLAEGEVDLVMQIGTETASKTASDVRSAAADDIPVLQAAAAQAFAASRFRAPWYRPADSGRFYATWIEKAVLGTFDHLCLLALDRQGQPEGFVSLRDIGDGEARIGLLAAFPGAGGKGIGSRLMTAAAAWCQQQQLQRLRVATQISNIAALRLYQRHGAVIDSTAYWLYRGSHDSI